MKLKNNLPALFFLLTLTLTLEILCKMGVIANYILPAPSGVIISFTEAKEDFVNAFLSTLFSSSKGLALSFLSASLLSFLLILTPWLEKAILPFCVFFQTVPIIAISPLMVIWFGFGEPTVIASAAIVSFFPILANNLMGLKSIKPGWNDLFKIYHASPLQKLIYLQIPSCVSSVFTGLKIASGLSIIGAIVGEFIGGGGLGGFIDSARTQQKTEWVYAAVILSSLIGFIYLTLVNLAEKLFIKYTRIS